MVKVENFKFYRIDLKHDEGKQEIRFTYDKKCGKCVLVTITEKKKGFSTTRTHQYTTSDANDFLNELLMSDNWNIENEIFIR